MKIAIWHNLPSGGGKRALYYQVKELKKRGHTIESWCPPTADQSYLPLTEFIPEHIVPFSWESRLSGKISKALTPFHDIIGKIKAMREHCKKCAEEINSGGFDILYANACTFFRTTPIGQYVSIPRVLYLPEPYRWLYEALPRLPWVAPCRPRSIGEAVKYAQDIVMVHLLRIQMREEIENATHFDKVLVNSFFSRESVLRAYGIDAEVCYLGVDTNVFYPQNIGKENLAVGLGGVYLGKRIERAILGLATIPKGKRPALVWIGNFSDKLYQGKMEAMAKDHEVELVFKICLDEEKVVTYLNKAKFLIYTSQLEPFGFAPLEANACGTPVVAIREGGMRETITEGINGFFADNDDPKLLGNAMKHIIDDELLSREMGKRSREYVEKNWNLDLATDRLESVFQELTKKEKNV